MSTDIQLIVVGHWEDSSGQRIPFVLDYIGGIGFSEFAHHLEAESAVGYVRFVELDPDPDPGLRRYHILDPDALFETVSKDYTWCWPGMQRIEDVLDFYQQHRGNKDLAWYFHVD